jgi:hypothetical protein
MLVLSLAADCDAPPSVLLWSVSVFVCSVIGKFLSSLAHSESISRVGNSPFALLYRLHMLLVLCVCR